MSRVIIGIALLAVVVLIAVSYWPTPDENVDVEIAPQSVDVDLASPPSTVKAPLDAVTDLQSPAVSDNRDINRVDSDRSDEAAPPAAVRLSTPANPGEIPGGARQGPIESSYKPSPQDAPGYYDIQQPGLPPGANDPPPSGPPPGMFDNGTLPQDPGMTDPAPPGTHPQADTLPVPGQPHE